VHIAKVWLQLSYDTRILIKGKNSDQTTDIMMKQSKVIPTFGQVSEASSNHLKTWASTAVA
jgi:hypothetical protein